MSQMKNFRSIADEIMGDINVDKELRKKTLMRCKSKKNIPIGKLLIPAACFMLILGMVNISHILPLRNQVGEDKNPPNSTMMGTGEGMGILSGDSNANISIYGDTVKKWFPETVNKAKENFGSYFLTPEYIPQNYQLEKISASGAEESMASKIILSYFAGEQSFMIIEEKTEMPIGFSNFEQININGTTGLLKPSGSIGSENEGSMDTELHWFKDGVHYSVAGLITQEEAIKVARSMK